MIEAEHVSKALRPEPPRRRYELSRFPPGGIVGVIGPNGAGKTTLFRMITGQEQPDAGTIRKGETVVLAYVDQSRTLDPDKSIWEEITGGEDVLKLGHARSQLARLCGAV